MSPQLRPLRGPSEPVRPLTPVCNSQRRPAEGWGSKFQAQERPLAPLLGLCNRTYIIGRCDMFERGAGKKDGIQRLVPDNIESDACGKVL